MTENITKLMDPVIQDAQKFENGPQKNSTRSKIKERKKKWEKNPKQSQTQKKNPRNPDSRLCRLLLYSTVQVFLLYSNFKLSSGIKIGEVTDMQGQKTNSEVTYRV